MRLYEICETKVPYIIRAGNHLGEFCTEDIVAYFEEENLPEVVTKTGYNFKEKDKGEQARVCAKNLAKITDKKPDYFLARGTRTGDPISLQNVTTHLIYDPKTDLTHIFLLPKGVTEIKPVR
jgi:hypothetical protein